MMAAGAAELEEAILKRLFSSSGRRASVAVAAAVLLAACGAPPASPVATHAPISGTKPSAAQSATPQVAVAAPAGAAERAAAIAPTVAHHQHLFSPRTAELIKLPVYDGAALIADLDRAGIEKGVVLSMGYTYADERKKVPQPDRKVREENDWTAAQVAQSGGRLIGFCSVNPLRDAAVAEVERCVRLPHMSGLKLHFGNSGVNLRQQEHVAKVARVLTAANAAGAPIVVHMRIRTSSTDAYGVEDAQLFIDKLLPVAPDVVVQVAHLAGAGAFPEDAEKAMDVFAQAIARKDPRMKKVYFDATTVATPGSTKADGEYVAKAIRAVGVERVLFGSDAPFGGNPPPGEAWEIFRTKVPLTEDEFRTIATNVAPYVPHH